MSSRRRSGGWRDRASREFMASLLTREVTKQARSAFRNIFGGR